MMPLKPLQALQQIEHAMKNASNLCSVDRWQAQDIKATMAEVLHYQFRMVLTHGIDIADWQKSIPGNYPWAEDHFNERVCGWPLNPGIEWQNWPWASKADESRESNGQFNHNYMERFWPKFANDHATFTFDDAETVIVNGEVEPMVGIRNQYGDLGDLITMLSEEPATRQAYLPIWFPEDTAYENRGRKPCTLWYHFIVRNGKLDITYHIRSCYF